MVFKEMFRRRSKSSDGRARLSRRSHASPQTTTSPPPDQPSRIASNEPGPNLAPRTSRTSLAPSNRSTQNVDTPLDAPPVPQVPANTPAVPAVPLDRASLIGMTDRQATHGQGEAQAYALYQRPERSSTISTSSSQASTVIQGRYNHTQARRAASLVQPSERPVTVNDTGALGTKRAVDYSRRRPVPSASIPPVPPRARGVAQAYPGAEDHEAYPNAGAEDVRSPLLETDVVPGFPGTLPDSEPSSSPDAREEPVRESPSLPAPGLQILERIVARRRDAEAGEERARAAASSSSGGTSPASPAVQSVHPALRDASQQVSEGGAPAGTTTTTEDAELVTRVAEPVYHETYRPTMHHIVQNVVEREVHDHHVEHRVLPIRDVQHLPARHFVPHGPNGALIEVDESQLPADSGPQVVTTVHHTTTTEQPRMPSRWYQSRGTQTDEALGCRCNCDCAQRQPAPARMGQSMAANTSSARAPVIGGGAMHGAAMAHEQRANAATTREQREQREAVAVDPSSGTSLFGRGREQEEPHGAETTVAAAARRAVQMHHQ